MESGIFKYVLRYSARKQLFLLFLAVASFPFLYMSLDIPKTIINKAIGGTSFPQNLLGFELDQIPYLLGLCGVFIVLVFINGAFKFYINIYRGILAERLLRRLRFQLIERVMRFPLHYFRSLSQGEIVSMITAETEPLGGFFGEAFSLPGFQGGILLTLISFMFVQDPILGTAAIILYPLQAYFIPKMQKKVNILAKERVRNVRKLSERIGEMVSGVSEIHAHDTAHYELADFSERLGTIFNIRFEFYRKKFFIKFLNNFLAQLTPFFFFSIGGYLVIKGDLTLGSLVAVLAAYKDVAAPWKELLGYYQRMEDNKIKYSQIIEQFHPHGMLQEDTSGQTDETPELVNEKLVVSNLSLELDGGSKAIDGASFSIDTSEHVAIVGSGTGGRFELAQLIARQILPSKGKISLGGKNLTTMPSSIIGRSFAYVDQEAYIRSGTILDTILYGLKHHPVNNGDGENYSEDIIKNAEEANASGNSPFNINAEWVDFTAIGVNNHDELIDRIIQTLHTVEMEDEIFQIALQRIITPENYPQLVEGIIQIRAVISKKLQEKSLAGLVEVFDKNTFNANASVAENILFGTPVDETFNIETMGDNHFVLDVLEKVGLTGNFLKIGRSIAALMVELFKGLPPDHEFFERFAFIDADDLPEFQHIINQFTDNNLDAINDDDRARLVDLPFKMIPARHRLGLIDDAIQNQILEARRLFSTTLPGDLRQSIAFFDSAAYNSASSIQDNILFGKIASGKGESAERIGKMICDTIDEFGLRKAVLEVGLDFNVGVAGKRLSSAQRQKLSIARCLLKRPQMLVYNQAAASLDAASQSMILERIKNQMQGNGFIWVDNQSDFAKNFDRILQVERGKVSELAGSNVGSATSKAQPVDEAEVSELDKETTLLAEIPFFSGMERSRLKLLAFTAERVKFEKGQFLFMQGDMAEIAYVIIEGSVDVLVNTAEGTKVVATSRRGDLVGELALLCEAPRTANVQANDNVTALGISKDVFLKNIRENSDISANLTRIIADRLAGMLRNIFGGQNLYDEVTGLPNRELLKDRMKFLATSDQRYGRTSALILVRIDAVLKDITIKDKEELLREMALRLRNCLREADTLAYLDNFGFGVIANAPTDSSEVDTGIVTNRLSRAISRPFVIGTVEMHLEKGLNFEVYPLNEESLCLADKLF